MALTLRPVTGNTFRESFRWSMPVVIGSVVLATALTYLPALRGGFIGVDDGNNIFLNPQMGVLTGERVWTFLGDFSSARRYMPFGWLGFSSVFSLAGLDPAAYHAASLICHMVATVALLLAARNILALHPQAAGQLRPTMLAALVALGWALHPMRTEAVAWASGLLYTQATAAAFLAVWFWTMRWSRPGRRGWYTAGACVCLTVSLLTYPLAFGVVVVCWLLDRLAHRMRRDVVDAISPGACWGVGGGVLILGAVTGGMLLITLVARQTAGGTFTGMPTWQGMDGVARATQALYVWGRYLMALVLPGELSPIYTTLYDVRTPSLVLIGAAVLAGGVMVVGLLPIWRSRAMAGWITAYTAMALPVLGLTEHPWIAHDRYAGLLHPVLAMGVGWWLIGVARHRLFRVAAGLIAVGIMAGAIEARNLIKVWTDPWTYHARLEETLPRNAWTGYYLGKIPASVLFLDGRFELIEPHLLDAEIGAPGWSATPARAEFAGLIRQHEDFVSRTWPGRTVSPQTVLHYLHGKEFQQRLDWLTARAHFMAAADRQEQFREALLEAGWCELELNHPEAARRLVERAVALPVQPLLGEREREFWRLLAAVHRTRGELKAEEEVRQRLRERESCAK